MLIQWLLILAGLSIGLLGVLLVYIILFFCINYHWLFFLWLFLGNFIRLFGFLAFGIMLAFILLLQGQFLLTFSFLFYSIIHSFGVSITFLPENISVLLLYRLLCFRSFLHDGFVRRTGTHNNSLRLLVWGDRLLFLNRECNIRIGCISFESKNLDLFLLLLYLSQTFWRVFKEIVEVTRTNLITLDKLEF